MDGDESEKGIVDYLEGATVGVGGEDVEAVTEAVDGIELGEAGLTPFYFTCMSVLLSIER